MRKMLLLLISGLLIAFMAGSAMAGSSGGGSSSTVVDVNDNLIPVDSVDVPPGTTTTIYFHADPTDTYFKRDKYELELSVSGDGVSAKIPKNSPMPYLKAPSYGKYTVSGLINNGNYWTPTSTSYPIEITRSSGSSGDGKVTITF